MYCPNCRGEFIEGYTHCKKCDIELVESLPTEVEKEDEKRQLTFDDLKMVIFDVEKLLKYGGYAMIAAGVLYALVKSIVDSFKTLGAGQFDFGDMTIGIVNLVFQIISSTMWGVFYIALGHIIHILKDKNANEVE